MLSWLVIKNTGKEDNMKLLTKAILNALPSLYATDHLMAADKAVLVKFFCPWNQWSLYGVEYDPKQELFFGFVKGSYDEWGYFSLAEMKKVTGPMGLKIERDLYFKPCKFKNLNI